MDQSVADSDEWIWMTNDETDTPDTMRGSQATRTPIAHIEDGIVQLENGNEVEGDLTLYDQWVFIHGASDLRVWVPVWKVVHIEAP